MLVSMRMENCAKVRRPRSFRVNWRSSSQQFTQHRSSLTATHQGNPKPETSSVPIHTILKTQTPKHVLEDDLLAQPPAPTPPHSHIALFRRLESLLRDFDPACCVNERCLTTTLGPLLRSGRTPFCGMKTATTAETPT
jgi:hypothetical protein